MQQSNMEAIQTNTMKVYKRCLKEIKKENYRIAKENAKYKAKQEAKMEKDQSIKPLTFDNIIIMKRVKNSTEIIEKESQKKAKLKKMKQKIKQQIKNAAPVIDK